MTTEKVEKELREVTKVSRKKGEAEQAYLKRLFDKVNSLGDDDWKGLSEEAQLWTNGASEAREKREEIPGFSGSKKAAAEEEETEAEAEEAEESAPAEEAKEAEAETEVKVSKTKKASKAKSAKKAAAAKPAKPAKAAKAAKPAKATAKKASKANGAGPRHGTKTATVAAMLQSKKGCTRAEILDATGWPSVSVQQLAKLAGLDLARPEKEGRVFRYRAKAK